MRDVGGSPRIWGRAWPGTGIAWRVSRASRWCGAALAAAVVESVARIRWLGWLPRSLVIPFERLLIAGTDAGTFDPASYRGANPDVRAAGADPLSHYMRYGWSEGRAPNARFDDAHYRAEAGMVRRQPLSALAHFLVLGKRQGMCPLPGVNLASLGTNEPGLSVARIDPYVHLLGQRRPLTRSKPVLAAARAALARAVPPSGPAEVNVVMPVYLGRAETLNAISRVLLAVNDTRFSLVVIDDATPEPGLADDLDALASRGLIRLLRNPFNRGFVASTNRGSALDPDRDVIWLNADTEVYDGWIDRLRRAAYSDPHIATATPMTNNGTICSYPRTNVDNPGELERPWAEIDSLAALVNRGVRVASPTAVGFCTYVKRAALEAIGPLDESAFGTGYGEENDFSQRAIMLGWSNVIAADVVVRHFGATSFRDQRATRVEAALKVLDRRYPQYNAQVQAFLARDPLGDARRAIDFARLRHLVAERSILIVCHARGGGTHQHVQEEIARLGAQGVSVFLMTPGVGGDGTAALAHAKTGALPGLAGLPLADDATWQTIRDLGIGEVHLHHLIDFGADAATLFRSRLGALGVPYTFTAHDYLAVCPRIDMTDRMGRYCGEPSEQGCRLCLGHRLNASDGIDIADWREAYRELLAQAARIIVPDIDGARRLSRYFPDLRQIQVQPHEPAATLIAPPRLLARRRGALRIAVVGAIGPATGFDVLLRLAHYVARRRLPVEFVVIGKTKNDSAAEAAGIRVTGAYLNADVQGVISKEDPDLIWIPSIWPETYCYTLSIALASGRPVAAFGIGALQTRLRAAGRGKVIPLDVAFEPDRLWPALLGAAREAGPAHARPTVPAAV